MDGQPEQDKSGKVGKVLRGIVHASLIVSFSICLDGCTRRFYRHKADQDVDQVLAQKDVYPQWKVENMHVYPDPRARFADPTNPDRPPMPPDDPAAHDLSPNPQKPGKGGIQLVEGKGYIDLLTAWDAQNRAADKSRPETKDIKTPAGENATGKPGEATNPSTRPGYRINLEQAAELGLFNSREYQDRREDLYLAALPVTLQRFAFAPQFYATEQAIRHWSGRDTPDGQTNQWVFNSGLGFSKLFSTGALLLVGWANQTVINLTGPFKETISQSTLSLDILQPLLRGGGRAVTLEPLTQAERNLLYEIRSYARFRKEFYSFIIGGTNVAAGAILPAGAISGISPGLVGLGLGGGITRTPLITPGSSGRLLLIPAILAPSAGYLPTLVPAAQLIIDQKNVTNLQYYLKLFNGIKEGGDVSQLQVDQVEQQLLQGVSSVLQDEQNYRTFLDQFKEQLGLPTDLPLELDDAPIKPLNKQFQRYETIIQDFESARLEASKYENAAEAKLLRDRLRRLAATAPLVQGTNFQKEFPKRWEKWERLSNKNSGKEVEDLLKKYADERTKLLVIQAISEKDNQPFPEASQKRLEEIESEIELGEYELVLRDYESQPWKDEPDQERKKRQQNALFRKTIDAFTLVLGAARAERLRQVRREWPDLPGLMVAGTDLLKSDSDQSQAVVAQTALINRLDLMNARAQLVDSWRQIAVFANALLGTFNVEYHLDTFSPFGQAKPLAFGGSRTRNQLIFSAELPIVRRGERNNYRASLIAYQRQRRSLMEAEDFVLAAVRQEIRQLRLLAENYRIQQRQVELAYLTVESALDTFRAPPPPASGTLGGNSLANAASLTQQLLSAQSSLQRAQNSLIAVWISYLTNRLQLYLDMELMQINSRGVWIDELATSDNAPNVLPQPAQSLPGQLPNQRNDGRAGAGEKPEFLPDVILHAPAQSEKGGVGPGR